MINNSKLKIDGDIEAFVITVNSQFEEGIEYYTISLKADEKRVPQTIKISFEEPIVGIQNKWNTTEIFGRAFELPGRAKHTFKSTYGAPVEIFTDIQGRNKLCVACSDGLNPIAFKSYVHEETAGMLCTLTLFEQEAYPLSDFEITIRLDYREVMYYDALSAVSAWWESFDGCHPIYVPEYAKKPMYSTWYSFHQKLSPDEVIKQCEIAKKLGCESVIVDDGWQTEDNCRGYKFCGDWRVTERKIPDMKDFVKSIHKIGMKFLLWYSVPFVGCRSDAWNKFQGMYLNPDESEVRTLDPRFPEVRRYVTETYLKAIREWNIDGLKLDFVDCFRLEEQTPNECRKGMDCCCVQLGVDKLLKSIVEEAVKIKPEIMIEFRQPYTGPLMRTYGNIFRASDCPNDFMTNRVRTIDLRLLSGTTAVNSDMIMWNVEDSTQNAALQIISVLFSVPQISVKFDEISKEQYDMAAFWIGFWRAHSNTLLSGRLMPCNQCSNYSSVIAQGHEETIGVVYDNAVIKLDGLLQKNNYIINGFSEGEVYFTSDKEANAVCKITDCTGKTVSEEDIVITKGINVLKIGKAEMARIIIV